MVMAEARIEEEPGHVRFGPEAKGSYPAAALCLLETYPTPALAGVDWLQTPCLAHQGRRR